MIFSNDACRRSGSGSKFIRNALALVLLSAMTFLGTGCPSNALLKATTEGDLSKVKELLKSDSLTVNTTGEWDTTPLHLAAFLGEKDIVAALITGGANINAVTAFYRRIQAPHPAEQWGNSTPLHFAAWQNQVPVAEILLAHGANVNAKNANARMPLHWAAWNGNIKMAELLLAHGADIQAKCNDGYTVWAWALLPRFYGVMEIPKGDGVTGRGDETYTEVLHREVTALHLAAYNGHRQTVEFLLSKGAEVNAKGNDGSTPLIAAAQKGHKEVMQLLIAKGADANIQGKDGSALTAAANNGQGQVVQYLIDLKVNMNLIVDGPHYYGSPLFGAIHYNHGEVAKILISNGADINAGTDRGETPLLEATYRGLWDVAKILILKGATVNARDFLGFTPLSNAVRSGNKETVELLVAHGAEVNAKDNDGRTPLFWALNNKNTEIADQLRRHGAVK
jgi:serine/threonine-protein phosphatase 6 regulatory ankyrin repeat subunit B